MDQDYYEDEDGRWIVWDFNPTYEVRRDRTEAVYVDAWQALHMKGIRECAYRETNRDVHVDVWYVENEPRRFPLLKIFDGIPKKEDTQVMSNMIAWLGSHPANNFFETADRLAGQVPHWTKSEAYLAQWAIENKERPMGGFMGSSLRPRERLTHAFYEANGNRFSTQHFETLEKMICWFGGEQGQDYLNNCRAQLQEKFEKEKAARMAAYGFNKNNP